MSDSVCKIWNLPADKMALRRTEDEIYNDYGIVMDLADGSPKRSHIPPELTDMASDWVSLTPDQQVSFRVQIQAVAEYNRKQKRKK